MIKNECFFYLFHYLHLSIIGESEMFTKIVLN